MKHIKKISEFFGGEPDSELLNEIEEKANMYLSYLIDDGYDVEVTTENTVPKILIRKRIEDRSSIFSVNSKDKFFKYVDIKDSIIPFIDMLSKDYNIHDIYFMGDWAKKGWYDKLSDKINGTKSGSRMRKSIEPDIIIKDKLRLKFDPISMSINGITKKAS